MQFERLHFNAINSGAFSDAPKTVRGFIPQTYNKHIAVDEQEYVPPPPPTFSEAELQAAKDAGYRSGFIEGEIQGKSIAESEMAMVDKHIHALLEPMAAQIMALFSHYNQFIIQQKQTLPMLALAMAQKVAKEASELAPMLSIQPVITSCVERMLGEPELHIFVHPSLADSLEDKLASHFANNHEPGEVLIHKDALLDVGACRVEWRNGGMSYNPETIWQHMEQLIQSVIAAEVQTHEDVDAETVFAQIALSEYNDGSATIAVHHANGNMDGSLEQPLHDASNKELSDELPETPKE